VKSPLVNEPGQKHQVLTPALAPGEHTRNPPESEVLPRGIVTVLRSKGKRRHLVGRPAQQPGAPDPPCHSRVLDSPPCRFRSARTGLVGSTRTLVDATCRRLLEVWRWRLANPDPLLQPAQQWRNGVSLSVDAFPGYAPGMLEYRPTMLMLQPHRRTANTRLVALDDGTRAGWVAFN